MYYGGSMSGLMDFDNLLPLEDEDEQTLAAIDEGIKDAENGRIVPAEEVRKLLSKWITKSSSAIR